MTVTHKKPEPDTASRILRAVRKAEVSEFDRKRSTIKDQVSDVGTGQTILRIREKPMEWLINRHKIGPEEVQAAEEISLAFFALSSRLSCRGVNYERIDGGKGQDVPWPARIAYAVERYQKFANVWSARNKSFGDPTLEILIAAVVDERPLRALAIDLGYRPSRIERGLISGLRDYAARAGFVTGNRVNSWQTEAALIFGPHPELRRAMQRARVEG